MIRTPYLVVSADGIPSYVKTCYCVKKFHLALLQQLIFMCILETMEGRFHWFEQHFQSKPDVGVDRSSVMSSRHPTYPHPTIAEAVCDIHFRLPETKAWKPSFAGELFKHIQDEYPEMEPVVEMGLQMESGPAGTGTKILPQSQKVRFKHRTRSLVLQLSDHSFSISTLPPYQGWEIMRTEALAAWRHAEEVLQPVVIRRLGVRYINQFEKETDQDHPGDWFVANDY